MFDGRLTAQLLWCVSVLQKEAEDALAEALPALEAARLALDDLDKNDVTEIRSALTFANTSR